MRLVRSLADSRDRRRDDSGSAVVEFLGVAVIVLVVALALIQLVLALHVRNTMMSSAYAGATHAALADRNASDGADRAQHLMAQSFSALETTATAQHIDVDGRPATSVTVEARVPLVGFWGPTDISVTARAIEEADA